MDTFDISGPLPQGTTLLEASAGTGKTWTIAALVTRYVAEGAARLDELLVVTFTRAASQELRERVRQQLLRAAQAFETPPDEPDSLVAWLLDCSADERERRHERLRDALAAFDAATIATIHQFCQLVLRSLGVAGDSDTEAVLVEDLEQLTGEVVDDLYLAAFAGEERPPWTRAEALALAREVVNDPRATVEPVDVLSEAPDSAAAQRVRFAQTVLDEIERRKRQLGILSYDDLLGQLADALADPDAAARSRMRSRWKVALIDEFQDTDPVQWQVFERAFDGVATLVLIGDPKQAIYAFRGGDVVTYLRASQRATTRQTLGVNWRSDTALVDSLHALLQGAALGDEEIVVHPVTAHHPGSRLEGAGAPFRLRVARREELGWRARRTPGIEVWREHVARDLAADVKRLLTSGATIDGRAVQPRDVAVLAARRADLERARAALAEVGVPAVVAGGGSVFHSPAAQEWLALLEALEQPHREPRVRAAAMTSFLGYDPARLDGVDAQAGARVTDELSSRLRLWSQVFAARGVAAVMECAVLDGLTSRCLGVEGGQRLLTDLRHIAEALHRVQVSEQYGVVGLLGWLREQVADDKLEVASERTRRLDSDAAAVQLVTIHGSKGLEYPIVYLPSLWDRFVREPDVPLYHDADGDRCLDVGGPSPYRASAVARNAAEEAGESLRLLYVALTRARSQVVAWYAPSNNTAASPLHRVLFGRRPGGTEVPDSTPLREDDVVGILGAWRDAGGPQPELAVPATVDPVPLEPDRDRLAVRTFTREVDTAWRRTSYTALARPLADAHGHGAALSEPDEGEEVADDDALALTAADPDPTAAAAELAAVGSPMAALPVGATFGSLVHAVLEHADPSADDLHAELRRHVDEQLEWWPVEGGEGFADDLATALVAVNDSPLGPLAGDVRLRDVTMADRLPELDFELPLGGGDVAGYPVDDVVLGDLAPLLARHLPADDPVGRFAEHLRTNAELADQPLRGYLTGSIDVVMRTEVEGETRYLTVDYKTNWLGDLAGPLTAYEYRPEALDDAMGHSDYPLQALLYTVVLHRYLRWRLPGYDPATHLGGVLYLYLRGMCGGATPRVEGHPCGVFSWRPPVGLVTELSDLLDGVRPTAPAQGLVTP
ncbi:MAG: UvrD-helicase domain-containing protein [Nocardioides sp.]|uniref:UvrD-helicase domain-containing protein n=1 Tax=Nocardioides sp. TaxID=35761 RepID=UPI003F072B79